MAVGFGLCSCLPDRWVCTVTTTYCLVSECQPYTRFSEEREIWCDLLIQRGKKAEHCHANVVKQLNGVACVTWIDELRRYTQTTIQGPKGKFISMKPGVAQPNYYSIVLITTDNGSDEKRMRDTVSFLMAFVPWVLVIELMCYLHQVPSSLL